MEGTCGCTAMLGDGSAALKLQTNRPLFLVHAAPPGFTTAQLAALYEDAFGRWSAVANVRTRRIFDLAEVAGADVLNLITVADLGGSGVLADQVLPNGSSSLRMRINSRINWRATDLGAVLAHEIGHFLGLQHFPEGAPPELMEPRLSSITHPQPTEARVVAGWFGQPVNPTPAPPPTPTPPPAPSPAPPQPPKPNGGPMREAAHQILDWVVGQLKEAAKATPQIWDDTALAVFDRFDNQLLDLVLDRLLNQEADSLPIPTEVVEAMKLLTKKPRRKKAA